MTSDAKIGLLLGLVFIFIIAFVINGLPRFQNTIDENEPVAEEGFVQGNSIDYGIRNSDALGYREVEEEYNPVVEEQDTPEYAAINIDPWVNAHATVADNNTRNYYFNLENESTNNYSSVPADMIDELQNEQEEELEVAVDDSPGEERLRLNLPTSVAAQREVSLDNSNNRPGGQMPNRPVGAGMGWGNGFGAGNPGAAGNQRQWNPRGGINQTPNTNTQTRENTPNRENAPSRENTPNTPSRENTVVSRENIPNRPNQNTMAPPARQQRTAQPTQMSRANNSTFKEQSYTIEEGDNNLAKIAKKFYGEEEGNRLVNINRIFEANKSTLKSPDKIFVGQELVIPQPAPPVEARPSDVLRGNMFENATSTGGAVRTENSNLRLTAGSKWYVVKEDDSLWKIAAEQLGKGTRYQEISKMNTDILTNENKLKPGMKLRLPAN